MLDKLYIESRAYNEDSTTIYNSGENILKKGKSFIDR